MEFLKNYWYPLALSSEVTAHKPYGTSLLGDPLVLFRDGNGRVLCLHDACPHQGTPLSLGSVKEGNLECAYHGWQFGEGGECKKIPSLAEHIKIPKSAKCRFAYPTEEHGKVIWVWAGNPAKATPLRLPEGTTEEGWTHDVIVREQEVSHHIMVAGTFDFTHIAFMHTNSLGKKRKFSPGAVEVDLVDYDHGLRSMLRNPDSKDGYDDMVFTFEPPCLVQIASSPKPGWRLVANQYPVPLTKSKTRLFLFICRNWLTWNPLVSWQLRRLSHQILDEDLPIVKAQYERHESGDGYWNCSVRADILFVRYRQWYEREARKFAENSLSAR